MEEQLGNYLLKKKGIYVSEPVWFINDIYLVQIDNLYLNETPEAT